MLLSEPGRDFDGGEFVLVEQRPRKQSLAHVVPLRRGDAVVFPNSIRPARGARGFFRTTFRHGVGEVRAGERVTLGPDLPRRAVSWAAARRSFCDTEAPA